MSSPKLVPRAVGTCEACHGELVSVPAVAHNRYGKAIDGRELQHIGCLVCDSTGKVPA